MKRFCFFWLFPCLITPFLLAQSKPASLSSQSAGGASDPKAQARILDSYGKLPLSFEANHGQTDSRVKFFTRAGGYSLFLTADEAVIALRGKAEPVAPKVASGFRGHAVSLKRYPDTNLSLLRSAGTNPSVNRYLDTNPSVAPASEKMTGGVLRMKLRGANPAAEVTGVDEQAGTSNYFIGNDPAKWRTGVPTYAKVKYAGIYSGIDLVYYGNQRQLEYDFIVAPGADPRRIAFEVRGAKRIFRDAHGELVFKVGDGEVRWHRPMVYQEKDGGRQLVAARYVVASGHCVGFAVGKYDARRALYIDPLVFSTYLGGSSSDSGQGIAVDSAGNAYVTGATQSVDFPVTPGAFRTACNDCGEDAFVAKLNSAGSALVYSTYLGGVVATQGFGIVVDGAGNAHVVGSTSSPVFPVTPGAFQTTCGDTCGMGYAFVTEINPAGSALIYSTYLGGGEGGNGQQGFGIAVDSVGSTYVTGYTDSTDFPVTTGAFQTTKGANSDAFVSQLNPTGSALVYSTYLGGSGGDLAYGIALDSAGNAYVTGFTGSTDFPVTTGAFQTVCGSCYGDLANAFLTKLNPAGSALVYSTYLGGSGTEQGLGIVVDGGGSAYVTGYTSSTNFPTMNPIQPSLNGQQDAFVAMFNPTGSALVYSTYLGGSGDELGWGITLDSGGDAYIAGQTASTDFPVMHPSQSYGGGQYDAFVTEISPKGSALVYSTYIGGSGLDGGFGIAVDSSGNTYVTGETGSTNFPTVNPLQPTYGGGHYDAFVAKIGYTNKATTTTTLVSSVNPSVSGKPVTFTAAVSSSEGTPTGKIQYLNGTTILATKELSSGSAKYTTSKLPPGADSVTSVYEGDADNSGSTSAPVLQVVLVATTTILTSSPNPSTYRQPVTFTAVVASGVGVPPDGETVSFMKGKTVLGTATLSGGSASFTTSTLKVGTTSIKAVYGGDSNFAGSTSKAVKQVVEKAGK
jgi:hypothetical protein